MAFYTLENSNKILIKNGEVDSNVLVSLIKEAYEVKGLSESDWIRVRRENGGVMEVNYGELYGCYLSLDKERRYHYADKEPPIGLCKTCGLETFK